MAQIEKLKQEHEAKTKLFNDKLEFENLQAKIRGGSCQFEKIRELREEKARLASEQYKDPELERVKKLIQEREWRWTG